MSPVSPDSEPHRLVVMTNYRVLNILILVTLWSVLLGLVFDIALRYSSAQETLRVVSTNTSDNGQNQSSVEEADLPSQISKKWMRMEVLRKSSIAKMLDPHQSSRQSPPRQQRKRFMSRRKRKRLVHASRSKNTRSEASSQSDKAHEEVTPTNQEDREMKPRSPKCLIVGFSKCGTEALKGFLTLHPDIVAPRREINFFINSYTEGSEWYRQQMPPSTASQLTLEKTPEYILTRKVLNRIKQYNPDMKLLVMIRDPIVRLQSLYLHDLIHKSDWYAPDTTFKQWCGGGGRTPHVASVVDYASHIRDAFDIFSRRQVLVQSEEELERSPIKVLRTVESFLGLPRAFSKNNFFYSGDKGFYCFNMSIETFSKASKAVEMDTSTGCFTDSKGRPHQRIAASLYKELVDFTRPFNKRLFQLLGRTYKWENFD